MVVGGASNWFKIAALFCSLAAAAATAAAAAAALAVATGVGVVEEEPTTDEAACNILAAIPWVVECGLDMIAPDIAPVSH